MASLRQRITLGMVGITSTVVLVAAIGTWLVAYSFVFHGLDLELASQAERVRHLMVRMPVWRPQRDARSEQRRMLQVVNAKGEELMRSSALAEGESLVDAGLPDEVPSTRTLTGGRVVRILAVGLPAEGQRAYLATDLDVPHEELVRLAWILAGVWLSASLLAWLGATLIEPLVLRPLLHLRLAIDRIGPQDLTGRIPDTTGPEEVRGLVGRLNLLLSRLEDAFRREQTTIGHIAHELRTPVTVLRTALEFRLLAAQDPAEVAVLQACFRTVERMQVVVSNLLLLVRLEAGTVELEREPVDLAVLIREQVAMWEPQAAARNQRLSCALTEDFTIVTAPDHFRQVLDNLLGNAVAHGLAGTAITIAASADALVITNACAEGLDPTQLGRIFYRADAARSAGDHAGLGLALCRRLTVLLGLRLDLRFAAGVFTARIDFRPA